MSNLDAHLDDLGQDLDQANRGLIGIIALVPADVVRDVELSTEYIQVADALYTARVSLDFMRRECREAAR